MIDLATGDQPVTNENGDVVAVFNGEIYNYRELRASSRRQGHDLRGTGDTPTLPHLYEQHGDAFVEHLDGMFALAVWDNAAAAPASSRATASARSRSSGRSSRTARSRSPPS